jgi:hypothetical protein
VQKHFLFLFELRAEPKCSKGSVTDVEASLGTFCPPGGWRWLGRTIWDAANCAEQLFAVDLNG